MEGIRGMLIDICGSEYTELFGYIYDFQAMIAGVLALVAAGGTVAYLIWQATDIRTRKRRAARAVMPGALNFICLYVAQCNSVILELRKEIVETEGACPLRPDSDLPKMPTWPVECLEVLRDCVEFADEAAAASITKLVGFLQVQHARLTGMLSDCNGYLDGNIRTFTSVGMADSCLADSVELYARVSILFKYARGEEEHPQLKPDYKALQNVMGLLQFNTENFTGAYNEIRRRFGEPDMP